MCPATFSDVDAPAKRSPLSGSRFLQAAAYITRRGPKLLNQLVEGGAGFEPAASRCAAGVLPEAPPTRAAATDGGFGSQPLAVSDFWDLLHLQE